MSSVKFPKQTKFIIGNEACERFGFYGMRSILAAYITTQLLKTEDDATSIIHLFIAINYLMPLIGGWISDKFWGKYKTILWISMVYCLGMGILACSDLASDIQTKTVILLTGLMIVAVGSGGIKPCVAAFMGDQFKPEESFMLKKAYALFYWTINFGSFFAFIIIPPVQKSCGWSWAFAIPGICMAVATLIFWLGRRSYTRVAPSGAKNGNILGVILYCLLNKKEGLSFWQRAEGRYDAESIENAQCVASVMKIFMWMPIFWALFDQTASSWVLQGRKMQEIVIPLGDLSSRAMDPIVISAEQFQAFNPAFVMILIPIMTTLLYPIMGRWGQPIKRMSIGLFLTAASFGCVTWFQYRIEQNEVITLAWQILPYFLLTIGEILISTTGLEFAYTQAPKRMKSSMNSYWVLMIFVGNLIVVGITELFGGEGGSNAISTSRFMGYGLATLIVAIIFIFISKGYKYKDQEYND